MQRGHFAEAVAGDSLGLDSQVAEYCQQRQAGVADGWLCPLGGAQARLVVGETVFVKAGNGEDHLVEPPVFVQLQVSSTVPGPAGAIKGHGQRAAHAQVLAALAGEQEGDTAFGPADRVATTIGAIEGLCRRLEEYVRELQQLGAQLGSRSGDHREAGLGSCVIALGALPGDPLQHARALRSRRQAAGLVGNCRAVAAGQCDQLDGQGAEPGGTLSFAAVLLQGDVEVGATEAKGTDACATRILAVANPGPRLGVDVEGGVFQFEVGIGPVDLDGRRQHLVVQGHDRLEQPSCSCGSLGVADLGLHRAQSTPLPVFALLGVEHQGQSAELCGVARFGAGAVCLDQFDGLGSVAGDVIGSAQGQGLPFGDRCVDTL